MDDGILTIRELAATLRIGEKTAYAMAQNGELPGFKARDQWRSRRGDIDAWIDEQVHPGCDTAAAAEPEGRS